MPKKTTRVRLTSQQKLLLCSHHQAHPKLSLSELCRWSHSTFTLKNPPSRSTLSVLFKEPTRADACAPATTKTSRQVTFPRLEIMLVRWIDKCEVVMEPLVNQSTIRVKAKRLRDEILRAPAPTDGSADGFDRPALKKMRFSNGWLEMLQLRHGLMSKRHHVEAASAKRVAVEERRAALKKATSQYEQRDAFNMDETAFFYCMVPSTSVSKKSFPERKNMKKRLTVAVTSNANGSFKLPLMFVGTARQPR